MKGWQSWEAPHHGWPAPDCCVSLRGKVLDWPRDNSDRLRLNRGERDGIRPFVVLSVALFLVGTSAFARPKEDVAAATAKRGEFPAQNEPDKVVNLYAADAVLWGTLSPKVRADRAALRDYFITAFKVLPGLKVSFGEQLIRAYGNTAVNTGYYTFSCTQDGQWETLPARYGFVFVKDGQNWMIVDHHSSAMPNPGR